MKRFLLSILLVTCQLSYCAAQQLTVKVDSVGQLAGKLTDDIRFSMSELKVCGPLNTSDLRLLQTIAGRGVKPKRASNHHLLALDLSEASIPESKGAIRMRAGALPAAMFLNCKDLERVVLPPR